MQPTSPKVNDPMAQDPGYRPARPPPTPLTCAAVRIMSRQGYLLASFKHPLESGEVGGHSIRVGPKVLVAHTWAAA